MEAYPQARNLATLMFERAAAWPRRPMLRHHHDGRWHATTWGAFARAAAAVARALRGAGVAPGDRVLIVSENRPEVPVAETALMAIAAVPVPAYITNTPGDHAHVMRDCGARVAIVSSAAHAARLVEAARLAHPLDLLVVMDGAAEGQTPFAALRATEGAPPDDVALEAASITPETLACLIYTSGTGGAPKGVMLPHRAMLSNCRGAFELLRPLRLRDEIYLSFLPLSHSLEHTIGQFFLSSIGCEIVYTRGIEHLAADLLEVRPTIMMAVPRVLEIIRGRILAQVARDPAWKQRLFARALEAGIRRAERRPRLADRLLDPLLDRLVRRRVRARFGGRFRATVSGGARLDPAVGRFYQGLGIVIMQGYGQTEAGPVISANPPDAVRLDTVGRALDGVELRIASDGEILVRGELVMQGYWGQREATGAAIRDGWLHTGDIGVLDADGYLRVTDRKKDMIVLSSGEKVSPARIEGMLMSEPEIAQAVVAGEGRAGISALLVPAEGCDDVAAALAVSRVNKRLAITERVRRHASVAAFTVENGLLTPTQKIRRMLVLRAHRDVLARLHA